MKKLIAVLAAFITFTAFTSALASPELGSGPFKPTSTSSTPTPGS